MTDGAIRVVIVADDPERRRDTADLLEPAQDIEVVSGEPGSQAVESVERHLPDVVLYDARSHGTGDPETFGSIGERSRILMLTDIEGGRLIGVPTVAGAAGCLVYGRFSGDDLARAIRDVARGGSAVSPAIVEMMFEVLRGGSGRSQPGGIPEILTRRERQIMLLMVDGKPNKVIAKELFISEKTVKNHINHIFRKLEVTNRTEAITEWLSNARATRRR